MPDGNLLQIGTGNHERLEALRRFRRSFLFAFVPLVGLSVAAGLLLSARALKPVRDLTAVTHRIVETGGIQERVPLGRGGAELNDLVELFNRMLDRIESLIRGMREALDNVAHDLRTPLTRLRAQAELALSAEGEGAPAYRGALAGSIEEFERMLSLLGTLMDISAAETGVMRLERRTVDVGAVIEDLAELHGYAAEEKGIALRSDVQPGLSVEGDLDRLRQVISNLLDNAVKYTGSGGEVRIVARREGTDVLLEVRDNGEGILAHELPRIWDRLYRGERGRLQPGLGLGLSVVRAVVQAHGGSSDVSSTPGQGSTFTVRLPAS
jgi:signal transduction histidine kinase